MTLATFSSEEGGKGVDLVQLAVLGQRSENTYNGVNCGIMDQFASSLGKKTSYIAELQNIGVRLHTSRAWQISAGNSQLQ